MLASDHLTTAELERLFPGDSEMAGLMRGFDWSASALGSTDDWPENLRVAIRLCLTSRFPICLWWARPLRFLYNDAFLPWLSELKHPRALMQLGREVWSEDWDTIGPMLERVIATGDASWSEDRELYHNRKVPQEEVYITWSFTPILAADGHTVDGIFCPCSETTEKVIGARRLETLRKLAVRAGEARSVDAACNEAVAVLGENARDIPFAAIYVAGANGDDARLSAAVLPPGEHSLPSIVRASDDDGASPWPLARVLRTKRTAGCVGIDARGVQLHAGPWPDLTQTALVVPIHAAQDHLAGLLVVGVSPRRPLDAEYRTFFDLVAGHVATAISGAREYEAQRQRAEALAAIDRAKTAFFSNVSHEFRTPLTLLLGPLEDELRENPQARERLEVAHRNALRLVRLVNTLLDFSRIEAGRIEAVYEPTDIATYTTELAGVFRSAIEKAGLKLVVECPPLPEPVYVDREMWEKIVLNLLSNAFKFTFEGEIKVSLRWCDERVEFCLSDTGVGVPAAELPRIFERFHRVRGTRARTFEGTGIGLALVQELVKLHGGEIKVQSEEGRGTSFLVFLRTGSAHLPKERVGAVRTLASTGIGAMPFVEEALRWLPDEKAEGGSIKDEGLIDQGDIPQSKIENLKSKILVADDNADMREYLCGLLVDHYRVRAVADGEAALTAAQENPPDLVLADVMMPGLDGFGLLKALREDSRTRNVPVVMLSARAGEESRVEGLQAGADDYLIKPFSARELIARVSTRLEIARLNSEAVEREHKLRVAAEDAEAKVVRENDELLEAQARTESILASVTDTHMIFDPQWRYAYVNEAAVRAIGRPRNEILGRTLWDLYPDIVGTELDRQYHRAMDERVPVAFDFHYATRDTWWANRFYPTPEGLAVFATEITERKRAEERLRESEERFRTMADNAPVIVWVTDPNGSCTFLNQTWYDFSGQTPHTGLDFGWAEAVHPDDRARTLKMFLAANERHEGFRLDYRLRRKDGEYRSAIDSAAPGFGPQGEFLGYIGSVIDITERKQAEEALQSAHEELEQRVLERTSQLSAVNAELIKEIAERNRAEAELLTLRDELAAELKAMTCLHELSTQSLTTTELQPLVEAILDATIALLKADFGNVQLYDSKSHALKIVAQRGFGQQFLDYFDNVHEDTASCGAALERRERVIVEDVLQDPLFAPHLKIVSAAGYRAVQSTPLMSRSGEPLGMISTHFHQPHRPSERELRLVDLYARQAAELIERKQAQEALHKAQAQLAHVSRVSLMGELAASIAHEINQPLGAIVNNGNVAMRLASAESDSVEKLVEAVSDIVSDANRASEIIARIRALGKKSIPENASLQLKDVVGDVLALVRHELAERRIEVHTELSEDLPRVSGDRVQLQQVLLNLVMNASEAMSAMPDEGRILTIAGQRDELDGNPGVRITVQDTGSGFRPQDAERLFEAFYTTKSQGMGMGLRISRSIIEAHNGRLWAIPNNGPGATFQFTLPVHKEGAF